MKKKPRLSPVDSEVVLLDNMEWRGATALERMAIRERKVMERVQANQGCASPVIWRP
jgi:hypothetical protein